MNSKMAFLLSQSLPLSVVWLRLSPYTAFQQQLVKSFIHTSKPWFSNALKHVLNKDGLPNQGLSEHVEEAGR